MPDIQVKAKDGSGSFAAYCAKPAAPGPGIVVIQEIFGVTENLRGVADDLAEEGYVALVPDVFWRLQPGVHLDNYTDADRDAGRELNSRLDDEKVLQDLSATVAALRAMPECTGKVGAVGFCLGGRLTFLFIQSGDIDCGVAYYPSGVDQTLGDPSKITKPLMIHMGTEDPVVPKPVQDMLYKLLGENETVRLYSYEGVGHAFARRNTPVFQPVAAQLAGERTERFFTEHLR